MVYAVPVRRLEDGEEIKTIGTSIGLEEKDWADLQRLATGECIVKTKTSPVPVKLAPLRFADSTALVLEPGEIPFEGTSPILPEGVPERLLRPPYIQAECLLEEILAHGLLSRIEAITLAKGVMRLSSPSLVQRDLIRYVFGRHLFRQGRNELLDDHLDYPQSPMPYEAMARYYAQFLRRLMSDNEADAFLTFVLEPKSVKQPTRILHNGAQKVICILEQDCATFGSMDAFKDCSRLAEHADTQKKIEELAKKLTAVIDSNPSIRYEWQDLCSHLFSAWRKEPSQSTVLSIINKYGIEEEEL